VLVDIDKFGSVNKTAGHAAGDALLRLVAERMQSVLGENALVGRLGGDEFAAVLTGSEVEQIGSRLLGEVEQIAALGASAGMALMPRDGRDADSLLRAVDVALRVAKRSGSHQLSLYAGDPIAASGPGGARDALERLIAGEGLEMAVQPIVALAEGSAHAYEALARFGLGTNNSPLHWFALADELGARDRLELACLRTALGLLEQLPGHALLSVNLSGPLLLDPRTDLLLRSVTDPRRLILELTENSLLDDSPVFAEEIARRRRQGFHFAVDDMGAGYSGLRQITTLHPSYLKLDRSLVSGIDSDPDRAALIGAMLGYVRQVGGHLIAEGVETEAEFDALVSLGVELIQGYLLGRPGPPWPQPTMPQRHLTAARG
jgi:predicted signal transduction protein with EAL and GGDEF domain